MNKYVPTNLSKKQEKASKKAKKFISSIKLLGCKELSAFRNRWKSNNANQITYKSQATVAFQEDISIKTVQRSEGKAERLGLLEIFRRGYNTNLDCWLTNIVVVNPDLLDREVMLLVADAFPLDVFGLVYLIPIVPYDFKNKCLNGYARLQGVFRNVLLLLREPALARCNSSGERPSSSSYGPGSHKLEGWQEKFHVRQNWYGQSPMQKGEIVANCKRESYEGGNNLTYGQIERENIF